MVPPQTRIIRAPRGSERTCKGWAQEAAPRMLMNNLDPEVAECPDDLVVYGGMGKAARSWEPRGLTLRRRPSFASAIRKSTCGARASMAEQVRAILALRDEGAIAFDYGNNLRGEAAKGGVPEADAFSYPGFVPAHVRPLFCGGNGPFRWLALSGDPEDIRKTDETLLRLFRASQAWGRGSDFGRSSAGYPDYGPMSRPRKPSCDSLIGIGKS